MHLRRDYNQNLQRAQKVNSQRINYPMKKWASELSRFFKGRSANGQKTHEEMLNIPGHKGNANQSHINSPPHSC
jgi:hypothetical protein